MIKKTFIPVISASLLFITASCTTQVTTPGDTDIKTRTTETDKKPGNILAEGRIDASGR